MLTVQGDGYNERLACDMGAGRLVADGGLFSPVGNMVMPQTTADYDGAVRPAGPWKSRSLRPPIWLKAATVGAVMVIVSVPCVGGKRSHACGPACSGRCGGAWMRLAPSAVCRRRRRSECGWSCTARGLPAAAMGATPTLPRTVVGSCTNSLHKLESTWDDADAAAVCLVFA